MSCHIRSSQDGWSHCNGLRPLKSSDITVFGSLCPPDLCSSSPYQSSYTDRYTDLRQDTHDAYPPHDAKTTPSSSIHRGTYTDLYTNLPRLHMTVICIIDLRQMSHDIMTMGHVTAAPPPPATLHYDTDINESTRHDYAMDRLGRENSYIRIGGIRHSSLAIQLCSNLTSWSLRPVPYSVCLILGRAPILMNLYCMSAMHTKSFKLFSLQLDLL